MAISKVILNGVTQMDITDTTATAEDVANGKVFYMASGLRTVGTASCGLTDDVKTALLNCFEHVAWIDDQGQTYYDELYNALHDGLDSISAVYTQTGTVYTTDSLDILRSDLVVTATYGDGTTRTVTAYTLSGTLVAGTSTVTVSYFNTTATFTVTVTDPAYITAVFTQPQTTIYTDDSLDSLKSYLVVTYYTAPGATGTVLADSAYTLSGTLTDGTSTVVVTYNALTTTFNVDAVDFYNVKEWTLANGLLINTGNAQNVGTKITSNTSTTRGIAYLSRGKGSIYQYNGGNPIIFNPKRYPIPIPTGSTTVAVNATAGSSPITSFYIFRHIEGDDYTYIGVKWTETTTNFTTDISAYTGADLFMVPVMGVGSNPLSLPSDLSIRFLSE